MSNAPDRIYGKIHTEGGVDTTVEEKAFWPDLEYILNTPEAMAKAGYVPAGQVVKPLVFGQHEIGEWVAETPLGVTYEITRRDSGKYRLSGGNSSLLQVWLIKTKDSFDEVVEVANADYATRILSALTTQSTTYDEAFAAGRDAGLLAAIRFITDLSDSLDAQGKLYDSYVVGDLIGELESLRIKLQGDDE